MGRSGRGLRPVGLGGASAGGRRAAARRRLVRPAPAIVSAARSRQQNIETLRGLFSAEGTPSALTRAGLDMKKVENAIALLDDQELTRLAARAEKVRSDFAASALTNQQLTYIVIALATAVIILVLVAD